VSELVDLFELYNEARTCKLRIYKCIYEFRMILTVFRQHYSKQHDRLFLIIRMVFVVCEVRTETLYKCIYEFRMILIVFRQHYSKQHDRLFLIIRMVFVLCEVRTETLYKCHL